MEKHTPGPWRRGRLGQIVDVNGDDVCFRGVTTLCSSSEQAIAEAEANTDLAIIAPELLAALKLAAAQLSHYEPVAPAICATIAKAEGGAL